VQLKSQKQLRFLQQNNPELAEKLSSDLPEDAELPEQAPPSPKQKQKPKSNLFRRNREKLFRL
jgi:hypothetical protein